MSEINYLEVMTWAVIKKSLIAALNNRNPIVRTEVENAVRKGLLPKKHLLGTLRFILAKKRKSRLKPVNILKRRGISARKRGIRFSKRTFFNIRKGIKKRRRY